MTERSAPGSSLRRIITLLVTITVALGAMVILPAQPTEAAPPNDLSLAVVAGRTETSIPVSAGDPVGSYEYIINIDNTGSNELTSAVDECAPGDPGYPAECGWVSIAGQPGSSPIFTQGDQGDFASPMTLPDGDYLISVLADGYKLGGKHFTVPFTDTGLVTVELEPAPLPAATIQASVFEDISPVNGAFDAPAEHGLAGFEAHIADYGGEVSTDIFGNPLGAEYDAAGDYIPGSGGIVRSKCWVVQGAVDIGTVPPLGGDPNVGRCPTVTSGHAGFADGLVVQGKVVIPNIGPNRYGLQLVAPDGQTWIQTTTLEGNHEWDSWVMEGSTGLDTEFVIAAEPFPTAIFGFVSPTDNLPASGHDVQGVIDAAKVYFPPKGGTGLPGSIWAGTQGMKTDGPIPNAWVALSDLSQGDTAIWVGQANANGAFNIPNVPDGNYTLTWWDEPQHYILDLIQISVSGGTVDTGILPLTGWWTEFSGYVFIDDNRNGVRDPGEEGVSGFDLTIRKRENSLMDRGANLVTTDQNGFYTMPNGYPTNQWMIMEAYNDLFYTTGITYQADNQPTPTTILGSGVDLNVLPIIGLGGTVDWGVHAYDPVGVPTYDDVVLGDSPIDYYRLGESTGPTAYDLGSGASNGTFGSAVLLGEPGLLANSADTAVTFDGTADSFVDTGVTTMTGGPFSVEAWVNATSVGTAGQRIVVKDEVGVTGEWLLWFNQGALRFQVRDAANANWVIAEAPTTPAAGTTFHVVGVFDGTDAILYVDGIEVARVPLGSATTNTNALPVTIGADSDPVSPRDHIFDGTIDEVAIYQSALTATQIQEHFDAASAAPAIDPQNGGIVGTVSYDTTRAELDARFAGAEDWQPSIPGLRVNLYEPLLCGTNPGAPCSTGPGLSYELKTDGAYATGPLLNSVITESWERPSSDCIARDVDGNPLVYPTDQAVTDSDTDCLEAPFMGVQFGPSATDVGTADENFGAAVDGNYGFGDGCFGAGGFDIVTETCVNGAPAPLDGGNYLVEVQVPTEGDVYGAAAVHPTKPLYKVTREEDINVGEGEDFVPAAPPPACAGALHTVDVADFGGNGFPEIVGNGTNGVPTGVTVPASVPTVNPSFAEIGDSIYEGLPKPLCDVKLVPLQNGASIAPTFYFFTEVPLPGRHYGLLVDDLNFTTDPTKVMIGEKSGIPFGPVGIYDFANNLVHTIESDYNGRFDVLLPSTNRINCATPAGVCANMFRFVGNDPGIPGRLNLNYKPQFRTISADFEVFPGLIVPADLAPTQVGVTIQLPNGQFNQVSCVVGGTTPQLYAVDDPYVNGLANGTARTFVIDGEGFGLTAGEVTLGGDPQAIVAWSDTQIEVRVRGQNHADHPGFGPRQLDIVTAAGTSTVNGLTFHVLGTGYNPNVYEVGPGRTFAPVNSLPAVADHAIQDALDAAAASNGRDLVVVYPGIPTPNDPRQNPRGAYYENPIIHESVKLQGVGPGSPDGSVPGSIIDGSAAAGDSPVFDDWLTKIDSLNWAGNQTINDGSIISIYAEANDFPLNVTGARRVASIDGFDLRGGNQQGFPANIDFIGGLPTGLPPGLSTQGGAIFANAFVRNLQITNNVVQNNGGTYGTIRIGTPNLPAPNTSNNNENIRIANNRIIANGGTNLAGAIGLFAGADGYEVAHNDICGNFSAEYGGGVSVYGLSPGGEIHHNRIYYNASFDEGGGVMIAGELPSVPGALSPGSGPVDIHHNLIQANLSNDDGGGLRFLMSGTDTMNVENNIITNNVSTHEGGGISINDATDVRVVNNTIMKNLTTATAVTSTGQPAPAGLSTSLNSAALEAVQPGAPIFSDPLLVNNIFWDNRAGTRDAIGSIGIGVPGDGTGINHSDMGVSFNTGSLFLSPINSVLQSTTGTNNPPGANNIVGTDPDVFDTYDVSVSFSAWRNNPNFVAAFLLAVEAPADLLGDYHIQAASPAVDTGTPTGAPVDDFDDELRPVGAGVDIGADESAGAPPPPFLGVHFSTPGNANPPGVTGAPGPADDADIYFRDTAYTRVVDASGLGLLNGADVDGLHYVDSGDFYVSFKANNTTVPDIVGNVKDEDIVHWNGTVWSMYFDGSLHGMNASSGHDINAFTIVGATAGTGGTLYFSTVGNARPQGLTGPIDNADIYSWDGTVFAKVWDATDNGIPRSAELNGMGFVDATDIYMSFGDDNTRIPGIGRHQDEDVVHFDGVTDTWDLYFDGTTNGLGTSGNLQLDAIDVP